MKSMEQELCCPVCDGMVKQPILLPCQHSVCLLCAAEVLVQRGYPPPDLPQEPHSPASTPNSRSPRQARRPTPRTPDRLEWVLRTGVCECVTLIKKTGKIFSSVAKTNNPSNDTDVTQILIMTQGDISIDNRTVSFIILSSTFLLDTRPLLSVFTHLCPFVSVRDIPRTETKGCSSTPHAVPVPFVPAGRRARGERPCGLPPQPHSGTDGGEVCRETRVDC